MSSPVRWLGAGVLTATLLLSACSSGTGTDQAVAQATDIASCDPSTVTLTATFGSQAAEAMTVAAAALKAEYPGLTIEAQPQQTTSYDDLTKQIVADIATGKRPDLIMTGLGQLRFWVDTYQPAPIDPAALSDSYQDQFLSAGTVDGTVYLAPAQISAPVLLINSDLAKAAGVDPAGIRTLDDLVAAAEKITARTGKPSVTIPADSLPDWFSQAFVQGSGETFVTAEGKAGFGTDKAVEALSIWSRLGAAKLEAGVGMQDSIAQFAGGNVAFMVSTTSLIASLQGLIGTSFAWTPVDLPSVGGEGGALPAGGNGWIVLSDDGCRAAFANALVGELLSTEAVLKASGASYSYIPVDAKAGAELLAGDAVTPQLSYAWGYQQELTPWGGFLGSQTVRVNDTLRTMAQQLASGADARTTVDQAVRSIDAIVGS